MQDIKNLSIKSHKKFKLLDHLIFSTKYRKENYAKLGSQSNYF